MATPDLSGITEFAWDSGNALKSQDRHNVSTEEAEQVFFGGPLLLTEDAGHSATESRYWAFGETREARHLVKLAAPASPGEDRSKNRRNLAWRV